MKKVMAWKNARFLRLANRVLRERERRRAAADPDAMAERAAAAESHAESRHVQQCLLECKARGGVLMTEAAVDAGPVLGLQWHRERCSACGQRVGARVRPPAIEIAVAVGVGPQKRPH